MKILHPLIVLQATPFCNIDCGYCYLPQRSVPRHLPLYLIDRIAKEVFSASWWAGEYSFLWHLGEPLTLSPSYYQSAFAVISEEATRQKKQYVHSFQTNATLIDCEWIDLFRKHSVRLGVSIDGPAFIHDQARRTRRGDGTHARTLQGIRQLQRAGLHFGAIAVITSQSLDYADQIFSFFYEEGIHELAFNIDELEGVHREPSLARDSNVSRYRRFFQRFVELIDQHGGAIRLRELWQHLPPILGWNVPQNMASEPLRIMTFDCDGRFNTFCPELRIARSRAYGDFIMGDISIVGLDSIRQNPVYIKVRDEIETGLARCQRECEYWKFCRGGEPSSKFFEYGHFDVSETITCKVHKQATVDAIVSHFEASDLRGDRGWLGNYGKSEH